MKRISIILASLVFMSKLVFAEPPLGVFDSRYLKLNASNQSSWTPTASLVTNLNADLLDGNHASAFATAGHSHDTTYLKLDASNQASWIPTTSLIANLNADLWDGYNFADYLNQPVKTTSSPSFLRLNVGTNAPNESWQLGVTGNWTGWKGPTLFIDNEQATADVTFNIHAQGLYRFQAAYVGSGTYLGIPYTSVSTSGTDPLILNRDGGNVGLGRFVPDRKLDVFDNTNNPQLRLTYADGTIYTDFETDSSGDLNITPSGGDTTFTGAITASNLTLSGNLEVNGSALFQATLDMSNSPIIGLDSLTHVDNAFRIDGFGDSYLTSKLGIGTTSPNALLNLKGSLSSALTGTVAVTNFSTTVTGTGTAFTAELAAGDSIKIGTEIFTVSSIASDTSLTLDSAYQGQTAWGLTAYSDPILMAIDNGDGVNKFTVTRSGDVGIGTTSPHSKLEVVGAIATAIATKTADYIITANDSILIGNPQLSDITLSLPAANGIAGRRHTIKNTSSYAYQVIVDANEAETIDGALTKTLANQYSSIVVISDGSNWIIESQMGTIN